MKLFRLFILLALTLTVHLHAAGSALPQLVNVLGSSQDTQFQLDVLRGMSQAMEGRTTVPMPSGWEPVETKLSKSSTPEIRSLTQSIGLKFGSPQALTGLKRTLQNKEATAEERQDALKALASIKDPGLPAILQQLLNDPAVRGDAIRTLAVYGDDRTPTTILAIYGSLNTTEQRDALNTLASRPAYAVPLMAAVEDSTVSKQALTADLLRQLRSLQNAEVNRVIERVYGTFRESTADKQELIAKFKQIYYAGGSTPGDAPRGRAVFNRICAQCHTLFDSGGKVGPDLTGSARSDIDYILLNMIDPNAVIPNEYRTSTIELKDDRVMTGIVKNQDNQSVTIATANETLVLPRKDIAEITQGELSMMPEGLLETLPDQEVRDLIYYLRQAAQAKLAE